MKLKFYLLINKIKRFYYSLTPEIRAIKRLKKEEKSLRILNANKRKEKFIKDEIARFERYNFLTSNLKLVVKDDLETKISDETEKLIKQEIDDFIEFVRNNHGFAANFIAFKSENGIIQISKQKVLESFLFKKNAI